MHKVAVLLLEPLVGFDAAIPSLCFGEATDSDENPLYRVITCGVGTGPIRTTAGYSITPEAGLDALASADTIIVPGTRATEPRERGHLPDAVRRAWESVRPGTRLVSICTGAFVLAAAGALDGRSVTTHWKHGQHLRRLYPTISLVEHVLFTDDGDICTSAGLAAGLDLCVHLIRSDHGAAVANAVARQCVLPPGREGTQAQFVDRPAPSATSSTAAVRAWAEENLHENLAVEVLARRSDLSVRTFNRRFRDETGQTPGAWVLRRRLDRARELLETSDLPVDSVAAIAGFGTGTNLRAHLRRDTGMTPLGYRRIFRPERAS